MIDEVKDDVNVMPEQAVLEEEHARVQNVINMFLNGEMTVAGQKPRILPLVTKYLHIEREERKKYFQLFGWHLLTHFEQMTTVPRNEILICRGREDETETSIGFYCTDALDADAGEDDIEQFFNDYDAFMRLPLCPYPAAYTLEVTVEGQTANDEEASQITH